MTARSRPIWRAFVVATACVGAVLLLPISARAQDAPPGSAVDQYVEQVPTASGSDVPGVTKARRKPLPRASSEALKKAPPETAKALEEIATSSDYGAPQVTAKPKPTTGSGGKEPDVVTTTSASAALRSSVGALGTTTDSRLIGLLAVLLVSALAGIALAMRRS